ncbi:MAG: aminopeptidase N [SAR324 cluster bacterium]|nr:aminopeptidase N [SAR324 cluster bacterium]
MQQDTPQTIYLKDYRPSDYLIKTVELDFDLCEDSTTVRSRLTMVSNYDRKNGSRPLVLDGKNLLLQSIVLEGQELKEHQYSSDAEKLTVPSVPESFTLEITTQIKPQENTSLEGLYKSSGNFCTQCEAKGFQKITYFLDRPDVMASYTTTITADQQKYPVLLSNGNLIDRGILEDQRHWVKWQDPFKKPSYLFALVAGDLVCLEDTFRTRSGRSVVLQIFVEKMNRDKCEHAMNSLKESMKWDEDVYDREYDLDIYMIVAVNDFNMGAMENKGLNVFNSKYVLAKPETATDDDYRSIEGVIAHEYFHNWTGNRITCRDWFQLSLKEGLTVFRDQCFSADMGSKTVQRINDVRMLRAVQFPEDAGPMAHSVRGDAYIQVNNFYTTTVYNKGAELIRMMQTLLGKSGFHQGMDLYFQRHDGQAVTTEDFVKAMEDATGSDLKQFRNWYVQAGTPVLDISTSHDADAQIYTMTVKQSCQPTPGQEEKHAFHIPLMVGLLDAQGNDFPLLLKGEDSSEMKTSRVLNVCKDEETFCFLKISHPPVPSLLRGFSAPVKLNYDHSDQELAFLMANDSDEFNRWEAGHQLAVNTMLNLVHDYQEGRSLSLGRHVIEAFSKLLISDLDQSLIAETLMLPPETYLGEMMDVIDVDAVHHVRGFVRDTLAEQMKTEFLNIYHQTRDSGPYRIEPEFMAKRRLKNTCLSYLMRLDDSDIRSLGMQQFEESGNMTDVLGALAALGQKECLEHVTALEKFYETWKGDALVIDKWFSLQALSPLPGTLDEVKKLMAHPAFELKNPNKVRALIGVFCHANPFHFHQVNGESYQFLKDCVLELDVLNPQIAARLLGCFSHWRKHDEKRQILMKAQLEEVLHTTNLSSDVYEIATKSLD